MRKLLIFILLLNFSFAFARLNLEPGNKHPVTCIESRETSELFLGFFIYDDSITINDNIYSVIDSIFSNSYSDVDTIFLISRSFQPYGDTISTDYFYIMHQDKVMRITKNPDGNIEYAGEDEMVKEEQRDIFTVSEPILRDAVRHWPLDTIAKLFTCSTFGVCEEMVGQSIQRIVMSEDSILEWQYILHPIDFPAHWSLDLTDKVISKYNNSGVDVNKVLQRKYWKMDTFDNTLKDEIYVVGVIDIKRPFICKNKTTGQKYVGDISFAKVNFVEELLKDSLHISAPGWAMLMTNFNEQLLNIITNSPAYKELSNEYLPVSRPNYIDTYYYMHSKIGNYKTESFVIQPSCYMLVMCNGQTYRQISGRPIGFNDLGSYHPFVIPLYHKDLLGLFDEFYDYEYDDDFDDDFDGDLQ